MLAVDQVSDSVLDACLKVDPHSKVACETAVKDNMVMVCGEITTRPGPRPPPFATLFFTFSHLLFK